MSNPSDMEVSRQFELKMYIDSTSAMYENALLQNGEIYDTASRFTREFADISAQAILADSRIIKILRYLVTPSISQMKFGQLFEFQSIGKFEDARVLPDSNKYRELERIAPKIADFVGERLDRRRLLWLSSKDHDFPISREYAKNWTCSLVADQNAQTNYRNWRKDQQEHAVTSHLIQLGYTKTKFNGVINRATDLRIGEFSREIKVRGRTIQKADMAFRSRRSKKLILIEAKAVGVELDATKRIKECSDKAGDWRASAELEEPTVVAVIAGFFSQGNLENLSSSGVSIVWEHHLEGLDAF